MKAYRNKLGEFHREDGPAIIHADGEESWWVNGKLHRIDGPAIMDADGREEWFIDGRRHRLGNPARTWPDGQEEYWVNDKLHRTDGPAVIYADGFKEWFIIGINTTTKVNLFFNTHNVTCYNDLDTELKVLFKMSIYK